MQGIYILYYTIVSVCFMFFVFIGQVKPRFVKQDQLALMRLECTGGMVCMEPFSKFQQMGRFTLRDEGKTIAIGKVLRIVE